MTMLGQEETECEVMYQKDNEIQIQVVYDGRKYKGIITELENKKDWVK